MCGIVGLIDKTREAIPAELLTAMAEVMHHRGPDGAGMFIKGQIGLAMRRLAIIDLAQGNQPLFSQDGQVVVFQNGEIYNFLVLRAELEKQGVQFKTHSDTEVIAHGYTVWGIEGLLQRLDGMYAIAILDQAKAELHLIRDRLGEKPLFFCHTSDRFAFGSHLLALAGLPWVEQAVDSLSLERYFALHFIPGKQTIFKAIERVLPGERLVVSLADLTMQRYRYYHLPIGKVKPVSEAELAATLEQAVTSRLIADVPVGIFLSGGLDSSIIAAIAAKAHPHINTFSMGFDSSEHDESQYAQQVAQAVGSTHHHFIFDQQAFNTLLPKVVAGLDEPIGDQAMLPLYQLCQAASQQVKVVLSGEGADELFAGYRYYEPFCRQPGIKAKLKQWLGHVRPNELRTLIRNDSPITPAGFPLLTDWQERQALLGNSLGADEWEHALLTWLNQAAEPLQRATVSDTATWLPDNLLVKFDRMAMANSLEGRAPYLHPRLVEIGILGLLPSQRMARGVSKIALRNVARHWLPATILKRKKQGFVLPMRTWLKAWFAERGSVSDYLQSTQLARLNQINIDALIKLIEEDLAAGVRRERFLFAIVILFEWFEQATVQLTQLRKRYAQFE